MNALHNVPAHAPHPSAELTVEDKGQNMYVAQERADALQQEQCAVAACNGNRLTKDALTDLCHQGDGCTRPSASLTATNLGCPMQQQLHRMAGQLSGSIYGRCCDVAIITEDSAITAVNAVLSQLCNLVHYRSMHVCSSLLHGCLSILRRKCLFLGLQCLTKCSDLTM